MKAIDVWVVSCYAFVCVALAEVIILYFVAKKMTNVKHDEMELVVSVDTFILLGFLNAEAAVLFYYCKGPFTSSVSVNAVTTLR